MEFLYEFGLFAAKSIWVVVSVVILLIGVVAVLPRRHPPAPDSGHLVVRHVNEFYRELRRAIDMQLKNPKAVHKEFRQAEKRKAKETQAKSKKQTQADQSSKPEAKRTLFVLDFKGDLAASKVEELRREITALLVREDKPSEVLVRLESQGGMVHSYGFAASQLSRIKEAGVQLTVAVDRVAASGGYMMAVVANRILAAPFAVVGSVGVVAELPNAHRLLKKFDIDYEVYTAGDHKRPVTMFGENTDEGIKKFTDEMVDTHELFKEFVSTHRDIVDTEKISTGETWFGKRALDLKLVDELQTSDQYIMAASEESEVFEVQWVPHKKPFNVVMDRLSSAISIVASLFRRVIK